MCACQCSVLVFVFDDVEASEMGVWLTGVLVWALWLEEVGSVCRNCWNMVGEIGV